MSDGWGERTAGDLSSVLVELARAVKGLHFYAEGHDSRRDILDRAFLAWRVELDRSGPLKLSVDEQFFRCAGVSEKLAYGQLSELAGQLRARRISRIHFTPALTRASFHFFCELLSMNETTIANRGGFARALSERTTAGIAIPAEPPPARVHAASQRALLQAPPRRPAPPSEMIDITELEEPRPLSLGSSLLGSRRTHIEDFEDFEDFTKPSLEENPLEAPATTDSDQELRGLLRELDSCADDTEYTDLAAHIGHEAERLSTAGMLGACYRAVLVLADHAVGHGGRSGVQLREAQDALTRLCTGSRLVELIDRACDPEGAVSVRAAQVLLQLGGRAVPPLLERLDSERDRSRAAQISAIVIALGERAVPVLVASIRNPHTSMARIAVQLAGELQSPNLVQTLLAVLQSDSADFDLELRREAAHSLVQIGGEASRNALISALESNHAGLVPIAIEALGALGDPAATPALLERLDRAVARWREGIGREIIRALASLGSEQAVPPLVSLFERRRWRHRREQREIRLAALGALGQLPGADAKRALERASRHRDPQIRQMATRALARKRSR